MLVFILGVSLSAAGCDVNEKFRKTVTLSKPMEPGKLFEAGTHNGSIRANGNEIDGCEVTATITGRGPTVQDAEKVTDQIQIKLEYSGDRLVAVVDKPEWLEQRYFSIDYKIQLPATTSLDFSTHNGSIRVGKILGAMSLSTHNGGINCYAVAGKVHAQTHNGSVKIQFDREALSSLNTRISTHNGSIEVTTPGELSAELNASTHNGSIEVLQPVTVTGRVDKTNFRGKMGTGDGLLHLRTHNGGITVR